MELFLVDPTTQLDKAETNIADAVWNTPASQAQIIQSITRQGWTYETDASDDTSLGPELTNLDQVLAWVGTSGNPPAPVTATDLTPGGSPPYDLSDAIANDPGLNNLTAAFTVGAVVLVGGLATWLLLRGATLENPLGEPRCGPGVNTKHHPNCRPGRPLCRYRRREKGICTCTAYHFPHRLNSGACRTGVPDVIRKSRSYRTG